MTAPTKLLSERLLRYSNELRGPSSGELVALLREAATVICDLSHDAALVRQSVEHGWAAAALAPPSGEGVEVSEAVEIQSSGLVGEFAMGQFAIDMGNGVVRVVGIEFARGWNEARLAMRDHIYTATPQSAPSGEAVAEKKARDYLSGYQKCAGSCDPDMQVVGIVAAVRAVLIALQHTSPQSAPVDGGVGAGSGKLISDVMSHHAPKIVHKRGDSFPEYTYTREQVLSMLWDLQGNLTSPPRASQERGGDGWQVVRDAIAIHQSFNTTADMADWLRDLLPPSSAAEEVLMTAREIMREDIEIPADDGDSSLHPPKGGG